MPFQEFNTPAILSGFKNVMVISYIIISFEVNFIIEFIEK